MIMSKTAIAVIVVFGPIVIWLAIAGWNGIRDNSDTHGV